MRPDPYAGDRIAYMNARRNAKPGQGGKSYAVMANPVDERAKLDGDVFAELRDRLATVIANSRIAVAQFRFQHTRAGKDEFAETIPF